VSPGADADGRSGAPARVGLLAPQYGAGPGETVEVARAADRAGLDVWLAGQMMPMAGSRAATALEPLATMGAVAAVTERARLGFMALAVPYLPPLYTAKALLTLDELSGGRVDAGLGAGWRQEEFDALGVARAPIGERLAAVEATVAALDELSGPAAAPEDARWPADARASTERPRPPVWIAGMGPRVLDRVARLADWANFAKGVAVEDVVRLGESLRATAVAAGRPHGPRLSLTATFMTGDEASLRARLAERAAARGLDADGYRAQLRAANVLVGSPAEVAGQLAAFVEAGCEAFVLWPLDGRHREAVDELAAVVGERGFRTAHRSVGCRQPRVAEPATTAGKGR
jgi:alkanesulfonate monooxygenase SsuD/methylene tetrahydromethanopterin reductase-like flavin-dependent oxidoreductase (luciferase family)